jgi:hypothetical protein
VKITVVVSIAGLYRCLLYLRDVFRIGARVNWRVIIPSGVFQALVIGRGRPFRSGEAGIRSNREGEWGRA